MTRITGKETNPTGPSGPIKEAIMAPAALQAPFASLPEASDAADEERVTCVCPNDAPPAPAEGYD